MSEEYDKLRDTQDALRDTEEQVTDLKYELEELRGDLARAEEAATNAQTEEAKSADALRALLDVVGGVKGCGCGRCRSCVLYDTVERVRRTLGER